MTNDQTPVDTAVSRARYERPVVIELDLRAATDGKAAVYMSEGSFGYGPS